MAQTGNSPKRRHSQTRQKTAGGSSARPKSSALRFGRCIRLPEVVSQRQLRCRLSGRHRPPAAPSKVSRADAWTVRRYYGDWIERRAAPVVRASAARDYRSHLRNYILDLLGDVELEDLSLAHLEDLRTTLRKRELSEKTIRNVIDGSFRAMVRDAEQDDLPSAFPFPKMRWPENIVPGPSPFTESEREQILDYFKAKQWKVSGFSNTRPHYPYFALLHTLFFTGMRPSEAAAIRIGSVNLNARTLQSSDHAIVDRSLRRRRSGRGEPFE
jgi:integrase